MVVDERVLKVMMMSKVVTVISVLGGDDHDDVLGGDVYDDVLGGWGVAVQEKFQSSVSEGIPGSEQVLEIHPSLIIIKF